MNNSIIPIIKELKRVCPICNSIFIQNHKRQKYCTNNCSKEAKMIYDRIYNKHRNNNKYHIDYYKINRENLKEYQKNYRNINRYKINQADKQYLKNRRKTDINFRILCNLRTRINKFLKKIYKSKRTIELVGCNVDQLKQHLKKQFTKGMTWKNYGKWEIDHIKPCSKFNLKKISEQNKCFHYTNLQPLWRKDNLKKSNNFEVKE